VFALASDLIDGRIARRSDAVTLFGVHADSLADAAFWTWFALRLCKQLRRRFLGGKF
jgi:phosphatidylglycerophosphate synthase